MTRRINTLFVFRRERTERLARYRTGTGPDDMLYGLTHLNGGKFSTDFIEGDDENWTWQHLVCYPFEVVVARTLQMGFSIHIAVENFARLRQADIIVSTIDSCGLPVALFKLLGLVKARLVYISQGLSDRVEILPKRGFIRPMIRRFYGKLLHRGTDRLVTLGEAARDHLIHVFDLPPEKVVCLPFGIDADFWHPAPGTGADDYILSVGSDPSRDYDTLLSALRDEPLKIVTRLSLVPGLLSPNVAVGSEYTDLELRELYRRARFVVIPLKDVTQPTGQSASLQAMACGKAVIISQIRGLWEPDQLVHLENCYLVEPGNPGALRDAARFLSENPDEALRIGGNARRTVESRYTSRRFAAELSRNLLAMQRSGAAVDA